MLKGLILHYLIAEKSHEKTKTISELFKRYRSKKFPQSILPRIKEPSAKLSTGHIRLQTSSIITLSVVMHFFNHRGFHICKTSIEPRKAI